ncbi:MAG: peptidase S41 [Flavobacterium sp.]|uniref:S41 family peptidase n=1 Tax=Flavobacterium sp. TaxID=239 RepID=UPI00121E7855|nr:S41 family peptidase [Flavobacterium sp.]RZJ66241.1 MAG: peptidase S41 [Flavobacterium sp.]
MRKIFTLLLLCCTFLASAQLSETDKLYATAKIWGFLKYYHPQVAKGKFDWDKELQDIVQKTKSANDKEQLSEIYFDWINGLGEIPNCKSCAKSSGKKSFDKNFDLSWTQSPELFTPELSARLKHIENNRAQGNLYYADSFKNTKQLEPKNEAPYLNSDWKNENIRLIALFRYWNQVEYFYPYKYMTDEKWDDVLKRMLPKFVSTTSETNYHLALRELVVCLDDSHANLYSPKLKEHFGEYYAPFDYKIIDDMAVVSELFDEAICISNDIKIGDIIQVPVADSLASQWKYLSGSNPDVKRRSAFATLLNGNTKSVNVTFLRDGKPIEKTIPRDIFKNFKPKEKPQTSPWKIMDGNIGYVNMGTLEFDIKRVGRMMDSLKGTKAIIFDIRNYPNGTVYLIGRELFEKSKPFVRFIFPDFSYPGKFLFKEAHEVGRSHKNYYKGKVILLVNEQTQSHAEFTVMAFQAAPNVTTIGSQTAGADGNVSLVEFPGGLKSYITGLGVFYPDGTETQRKGVKIDIEIRPTVQRIASGKDEVLEKAIEVANRGN